MKPKFMTAPISKFAEHPAQMRTLYQIEDMATLTLQVYSNDLDSWQPITATPAPSGGYYIISGHRRRMARLFAYGLSTWISQLDNPVAPDEVDIELVKQFIGTLVKKYEYVDAAAEALTFHYAVKEIEFVLFTGSAKEQILALQRANYGSVKPDMLGVAHSFQAALDAGATLAEIARNAGQTAHYVRNHLALNKLPQELAEKVADGELAMSIGIAVASINNEHKRHGLALFVLSNPPEQLTAKAVKDVAKKLANWGGLQVPLTTAHQAQRNIARSLTRLWHLVVDAYPVRSWAVISSFIYQDVNIQTPWSDQKAVDLWFKTIGGEHYYGEDGIKWESVVTNLITEVSCVTCPVAKLPERQLESDLSPGRSDVLGMPCRSGATGPCLHGLAPNDPFHVRVPWDWAEHEGIEKDATGYVALSFHALQKAWQAQATGEDTQNNAAITPTIVSIEEIDVAQEDIQVLNIAQEDIEAINTSEEGAQAINTSEEGVQAVNTSKEEAQAVNASESSIDTVSAPENSTEAVNISESSTEAVSRDKVLSPAQKMRQLIAAFIQEHEAMNTDHPFATPCAKCQHKLSRSPTKDESVPHCAWAGRYRNVKFFNLNPETGKTIPVCRQFAPKSSWAEIIPAHPQKAIMPREWIKHQIRQIVSKQPKERYRWMFEFLTGRPMNSNENHRRWFIEQFDEQGPPLSDEQLWTLMVWALAESARLDLFSTPEWRKPDDLGFRVPVDDRNTHFIQVSEIEFIPS